MSEHSSPLSYCSYQLYSSNPNNVLESDFICRLLRVKYDEIIHNQQQITIYDLLSILINISQYILQTTNEDVFPPMHYYGLIQSLCNFMKLNTDYQLPTVSIQCEQLAWNLSKILKNSNHINLMLDTGFISRSNIIGKHFINFLLCSEDYDVIKILEERGWSVIDAFPIDHMTVIEKNFIKSLELYPYVHPSDVGIKDKSIVKWCSNQYAYKNTEWLKYILNHIPLHIEFNSAVMTNSLYPIGYRFRDNDKEREAIVGGREHILLLLQYYAHRNIIIKLLGLSAETSIETTSTDLSRKILSCI